MFIIFIIVFEISPMGVVTLVELLDRETVARYAINMCILSQLAS